MDTLEGWVNTSQAAEVSGYTVQHIRRLATRGQVVGKQVGRDWLVDRVSLLQYKAKMARLGSDKHNPQAPWRDQERGR
jgi:hypothetical protein